jgi:hypothetical protein
MVASRAKSMSGEMMRVVLTIHCTHATLFL